MTLDELTEHAANLRDLLDHKRRQLFWEWLTTGERVILEAQADALTARVDSLMWECDALRGDLPTLQLVRVVPGIGPLADVVPQP